MKNLKLIAILLIWGIAFLTNLGCTHLKIRRNDKGEVIEVSHKGLGKIEVTKEGNVKSEMAPDWYPKDVINLYKD